MVRYIISFDLARLLLVIFRLIRWYVLLFFSFMFPSQLRYYTLTVRTQQSYHDWPPVEGSDPRYVKSAKWLFLTKFTSCHLPITENAYITSCYSARKGIEHALLQVSFLPMHKTSITISYRTRQSFSFFITCFERSPLTLSPSLSCSHCGRRRSEVH